MKNTALRIPTQGNSDSPTKKLKQSLAIVPGTTLRAMAFAQGCLERQVLSQCASLQDKLAVFDPLVHGGEVMQDRPLSVEFGAVLTDRNGSNF